MHLFLPISLLAFTVSATKPAYCPLLGPVFPSIDSFSHTPEAVTVAKQIEAKLEQASRNGNLTNSVSLQIFSSEDKKSFFKFSHSAPVTTNATHGVKKVTEDSVFRIASNSKLWTMYLLMIKTHGDALHHPVTKYVPALRNASKHLELNATERNYGAEYARWDQITVGELASHLAGITRDYGQGDLATTELEELEKQGFQVLDKESIPPCGLAKVCTKEQFFNGILKSHPLAPTSTTPIYSNAAFQILGYVLEEITGKSYETVLKEELINPLNLTRSSYSHPDAKVGVIPGDPKDSAWAVDAGDETPAGGLYSSAKDMAAIGRSILNSTLLPPAVTRRWMKPVSHIGLLGGSVGHPWEIVSLSEPRVIDLYTKNGDLGSYASLLVLSPDHKVGFTILAAGDEASKTMFGLADQIIEALIPVLEKSAKTQAHKRFGGSYSLKQKNTTMSITTDSGPGLKVSNWTFGGKDMFTVLGKLQSASPKSLDIRLYPTGLNNPGQFGFRAIIQPLSAPEKGPITSLCQTWASVDATPYGGVGLDEFIFDVNRKGEVTAVSARGFRLKLFKMD